MNKMIKERKMMMLVQVVVRMKIPAQRAMTLMLVSRNKYPASYSSVQGCLRKECRGCGCGIRG